MKIVIKGNQKVKMYSGNINYQEIKTFINNNFSQIKEWSISFEDQEGDSIMITSDVDLDVMKQMFPGREFMKINIESLLVELKKEEQPKQEKVQYIQESQEKREQSNSKEKSKGKRKNKMKKKLHKLEKLAAFQINKIVQQKIKIMIPSIINQVQVSGKEQIKIKEGAVHQGITCNGCNMKPIVGIRYKCIKSNEFNLCQICEDKIPYEYDLLKMRNPREQEEKSKQGKLMRKIMKIGKKLMKKRHRSSSSSSSSQSKDKKHRRHRSKKQKHESSSDSSPQKDKKCRKVKERKLKKEKKQKNNDEAKKARIQKRRAQKMMKVFGGQASDYQNFIELTYEKPIKEVLSQYAQENNINYIEDRENKRKNNKMRKLALYFNAKEEEFKDIVNVHPDSNFKELLKIVKETGMYDCEINDEGKIQSALSRFRWQKKGQRCWQKEQKKSKMLEKVEEKVQQKEEVKESLKTQIPLEEEEKLEIIAQLKKTKSQVIREKGKILIEMKQLFGEDRAKEIFKFIEQNFELGQERIVEKWIVQEFEKSQKK